MTEPEDPKTWPVRHVFIERRKKAHSNTRAAVDLVSNLGAVIDETANVLEAGANNPLLNYRAVMLDVAERLRDALRDDQAERAAFLEHFPHLCKKENHDD